MNEDQKAAFKALLVVVELFRVNIADVAKACGKHLFEFYDYFMDEARTARELVDVFEVAIDAAIRQDIEYVTQVLDRTERLWSAGREKTGDD